MDGTTSYVWGAAALIGAGMYVAGGVALAAEGTTAHARPYVSGGVGASEREALEKRRPEFSLWLATAAKGSGAYLYGAEVRIRDGAGKMVLDAKLDGPWLLADLGPGTYGIEVSYGGKTERRSASIQSGERRELVFYFEERE